MKYMLFGWRNVELEVPEDWFLAVDGGGRNKGYFRLDDTLQPRLEVTWEKIPFEKALTPEKMLETHKENLEKNLKKARKKGVKVPEIKNILKKKIEVAGHPAILWVNRIEDNLNNVVVWYCEKSERAFILNMTFKMNEEKESKDVLTHILKSIKCHYPAEYKILWSLFAASIRLPTNFILVSVRLAVGLSYAVYKDLDEDIYLIIGYSGLAKQVLSKYKHGLVDWFKKGVKKNAIDKIEKFGRIKYEERKGEVEFFKKNLSIIPSRSPIIYGVIWINEELNRIFTVAVITTTKKIEKARKLVKEVKVQLSSGSR